MIAGRGLSQRVRRVHDHVAGSRQNHVPENPLNLQAVSVQNHESGRSALDHGVGNGLDGGKGFVVRGAGDLDRGAGGIFARKYVGAVVLVLAGDQIGGNPDLEVEGTHGPTDVSNLDREVGRDHEDGKGHDLMVESGVDHGTVSGQDHVSGVAPHHATRSVRGPETRNRRNVRVPVARDLHVEDVIEQIVVKRKAPDGSVPVREIVSVLVREIVSVLAREREASRRTNLQTEVNQRVALIQGRELSLRKSLMIRPRILKKMLNPKTRQRLLVKMKLNVQKR